MSIFPSSFSLPLPWLYMYTSGAQCMIDFMSFFSFLFLKFLFYFLFWEWDVPLFCTLDMRVSGVEDQGCMNMKGLRTCSNAMNRKYLHKDLHLLVHPLLKEAQHLPGWISNIRPCLCFVFCIYIPLKDWRVAMTEISPLSFAPKFSGVFLPFFLWNKLLFHRLSISKWCSLLLGLAWGYDGWYWASILQRQFF